MIIGFSKPTLAKVSRHAAMAAFEHEDTIGAGGGYLIPSGFTRGRHRELLFAPPLTEPETIVYKENVI